MRLMLTLNFKSAMSLSSINGNRESMEMKSRRQLHRGMIGSAVFAAVLALGAGCSTSGNSAPVDLASLRIVAASGSALQAVAGDALALKVIQTTADGGTSALPGDVKVAWTSSAVTALPPDDDSDPDPLPDFGTDPTGVFINDPSRPDRQADLAGVLFVLDPGTGPSGSVQVTATISGAVTEAGALTEAVAVAAGPSGDATRGAALYGAPGSCARCHGATGHGSPEPADATSFKIDGKSYAFPAPGLNAEPGSVAGDPEWNAALLAVSSRSDVDNGGVTLRLPMPDWLLEAKPDSAQPFTTQDFADIYAFLQTQTQ